MLAQLEATYPEDLRVVYRHFPLVSIHDKALLTAQASEAAGRQGAFWEMHDLLFEKHAEWTSLSPEDFRAWLNDQVAELGLDATRFIEDLDSDEVVALAEAAWNYGSQIGIPGTPFLLINGNVYSGPMDYNSLEAIIKLVKLEDIQFESCPPQVIEAGKAYFVTLQTEKGEVEIELFPEEAPMAVNNFIFLAQQGWYDGVTFHRVIPGFVAQSGDPSGTGYGGPGYSFANEISPDLLFDRPGRLGMANSGPDTNGSQFFITYGPAPHLDGGYTIFGQVISGMGVLEQLTPRDPSQPGELPPGDRILGIIVTER